MLTRNYKNIINLSLSLVKVKNWTSKNLNKLPNIFPNIKAKNLFMKGSINNLETSKNNGMKQIAKYLIKFTKREKSFYCRSFKTIVKLLLKGLNIKNKLWLKASIKSSIKNSKFWKNLILCSTENFIRISVMRKTKS